ncbi:hypothetical protein KW786_03765 [Candidatus Parcubacteria bacterium]|nr:hypothetical protein [Candidatus Parcubacteria bacterium]
MAEEGISDVPCVVEEASIGLRWWFSFILLPQDDRTRRIVGRLAVPAQTKEEASREIHLRSHRVCRAGEIMSEFVHGGKAGYESEEAAQAATIYPQATS